MIAPSHPDVERDTPRVGEFRELARHDGQNAFTLIELMVVTVIIALLAALLLPALMHSKARAQSINCVHNMKQLMLAWSMYPSDNNNKLVYNLGGDAGHRSFAPVAAPNWINNMMDWELNPDNTNLDFLDRSACLLGNYLFGASQSIFRCPSDRALSAIQRSAGWTARVRSVSMNAMVGDPGSSLLQHGYNINNPGYQQFLKESDIPDASSIFVFLDEHPDSINDGYFLNTEGSRWVDLPGSYHNGGGSFAFADGHAIIHRWSCASTVKPAVPDGAGLPIDLRANDLTDFQWVMRHASVER